MSKIEDRKSSIGHRHVIWSEHNIGFVDVSREQQSFHAKRAKATRQTVVHIICMASHALRQQARHTIVPIAGGWFMEHGARPVDRLLARVWGMSIGLAVDVHILWL